MGRQPAMTAWQIVLLLLALLGALIASGFAGHRLAHTRMRKTVQHSNEKVAQMIAMWRRNETLAGAYSLSESRAWLDRPPDMLAGVEKCYYAPPDLERVTWVPRDMPTPFVGFAPAPGHLASAVINKAQFRYARELDHPKPRDVCRIFLTGGSTAFGCGASSNETTIGGYLEHHLKEAQHDCGIRCEVVTAAAGAWCSTHERILIENRLVELEPDLVISLSGHNDAFWAWSGRNILWFRGWQDDYFLSLINAALASNLAKEFPTENPGKGRVSIAQAAERLSHNVATAHRALATVGADYIFALQPVMSLSQKVHTPRERRLVPAPGSSGWLTQTVAFYQAFRESLLAIEHSGFHFLDATAVFDECDGDVDVFIDSAHFGDRGNDLIARLLCRHVLKIASERFHMLNRSQKDSSTLP